MKVKLCPACYKEIPIKEFKQHQNSHIANLSDISEAIRNYAKENRK